MDSDEGRPISVLIVDDEQDLVDTLAKRLRKRGFEVDTAHCGESALERLDPAIDPDPEPVKRFAIERTSVLLVDDEPELLRYLGKRLQKRGFLVDTVASGPAALDHLDDHEEVDVVVLDVKMVGMTGHRTLELIKERHPRVEVIMLTGHASVQGAMDALKTGALEYLTKPCDLNHLVEKVTIARAKQQARADSEPSKG